MSQQIIILQSSPALQASCSIVFQWCKKLLQLHCLDYCHIVPMPIRSYKEAVHGMVNMLGNLKHHIRTTYGDSESHQGQQDWDHQPPELGKGMELDHKYEWQSAHLYLRYYCKKVWWHTLSACSWKNNASGFAFMDNMDLIVNDNSNQTEKVHNKMQQSLALWHGLLWATRGDLVPNQCFWYLLNFQWENNKWWYKTEKEPPGTLLVWDENQQVITIPRLNSSKAQRTLEKKLAPDGNNEEEAKHLQEATTTWKTQIAQAKAAKAMVEFCFQQILMSKLTYAQIATDFTEQQCNNIMKPALNQALPAMGMNRHFPQAVAHGPVGHQGLALPNLFTKQICIHIITMIRFGHQWEDLTGQLLQANAEVFDWKQA